MPDRLSSLDASYLSGELSLYPVALDDRDSLYEVRNNASTRMKQTLSYNGRTIIADDAAAFPPRGLLRIGPPPGDPGTHELVYYGARTSGAFTGLVRGFAGSRQSQWSAGAAVAGAVMSEHHNAVKDAVVQIESNLGVSGAGRDAARRLVLPASSSLNGILKSLESRFLSPKPIFRASPLRGVPGIKVRFQNFSGGDPIRYLWDFGDGATATDTSPTHAYPREGVYTVKLNLTTGLGAQGIVIKKNYISVSIEAAEPFFYVDPPVGTSVATGGATSFLFVDQTDGPIVERIWNFGDGVRVSVDSPDEHTITHAYQSPGEYTPTLLVVYDDTALRRVDLPDPIQVD